MKSKGKADGDDSQHVRLCDVACVLMCVIRICDIHVGTFGLVIEMIVVGKSRTG